MLEDAGWIEGKSWLNEVKISGMPNKSQTGYADYVLYGNDGRVLAVIETKKICVDMSKGRQQEIMLDSQKIYDKIMLLVNYSRL